MRLRHNPDDALPVQCVDSFGRYSHGDRGRILLPPLAPGMVLDCTRGLDRLDRGGFKHGVRIFGRRGITEFHPVVRDAKDVAAGAMLITALASSVIGAVIFWPHVKGLLNP